MNWRRAVSVLLVLAAPLLLSGCDERKAVALKTAAEAFRDKAAEAIDAMVALHVQGAYRTKTDEQRMLEAATALIDAAKQRKALTNAELDGALQIAYAREAGEQAVGDLVKLKQAYAEFAAAFSRLPEGSAFAAKEVVCSASLGSRLVHRLAVLHDVLHKNPINLVGDNRAAASALRAAAATGSAADLDRTTLAFLQTPNNTKRRNDEVKVKLAQAAEAGEEVVELAQKYATFDIGDILNGLGRILQLRAKYLGADADAASQKVTRLRQKLEGDEKLKAIVGYEAINLIPECRG